MLFSNITTSPTGISLVLSTIIDLFIANVETERVITRAVVSDISDHFPIAPFVDISRHQLMHARSPPLFQSIAPSALDSFREDINRFNCSTVEKESCANSASDVFVNHIVTIYSKSF